MKYEKITGRIIECAFEVSKELGSGFLESVYEKAMIVALSQKGLKVRSQVPFRVTFRGVIVGDYFADLIVEDKILVELKAVSMILGEHKAQTINYLNVAQIEVGLLFNFGQRKVEYLRMYPSIYPANPVHPV